MLLVLMKEAQNIGSLRKSDPFRFSELNERDKELIDMTKQLGHFVYSFSFKRTNKRYVDLTDLSKDPIGGLLKNPNVLMYVAVLNATVTMLNNRLEGTKLYPHEELKLYDQERFILILLEETAKSLSKIND
ncbi:hypothetical protein [Flavobacterium davisii]|nr:hypothetical protein [Flavobacterium davisii]